MNLAVIFLWTQYCPLAKRAELDDNRVVQGATTAIKWRAEDSWFQSTKPTDGLTWGFLLLLFSPQRHWSFFLATN